MNILQAANAATADFSLPKKPLALQELPDIVRVSLVDSLRDKGRKRCKDLPFEPSYITVYTAMRGRKHQIDGWHCKLANHAMAKP